MTAFEIWKQLDAQAGFEQWKRLGENEDNLLIWPRKENPHEW